MSFLILEVQGVCERWVHWTKNHLPCNKWIISHKRRQACEKYLLLLQMVIFMSAVTMSAICNGDAYENQLNVC